MGVRGTGRLLRWGIRVDVGDIVIAYYGGVVGRIALGIMLGYFAIGFTLGYWVIVRVATIIGRYGIGVYVSGVWIYASVRVVFAGVHTASGCYHSGAKADISVVIGWILGVGTWVAISAVVGKCQGITMWYFGGYCTGITIWNWD